MVKIFCIKMTDSYLETKSESHGDQGTPLDAAT